MKKKIIVVAAIIVLSTALIASAQNLAPAKIFLDGAELESDVAPVIKEGRVLVPLRVIAENFGAKVTWDGEEKAVSIITDKSKDPDLLLAKLGEALAKGEAVAAVTAWAEGVRTRNGALQYVMMTPELQAKLYEELSAGGWTTGTSSPWVKEFDVMYEETVDPATEKYTVAFTYTDSTGSTSVTKNLVTVKKVGDRWLVANIEKDFSDDFTANIVFNKGFYRPEYKDLPEEIANWLNYSREIAAVQEKVYNGYRFVLITEGMKPTGGYGVEVEEIREQEGKLEVRVKRTAPGEGEMVTTALTYPFDLVIVENKELPLSFTDVDDPDKYFMSLLGIDEIDRPFVASSDWIKIFSPKPHEKVKDTISLSGVANVFEGTVNFELLTKERELLSSGFTTAAMGDWAYFEEEIPVPKGLNSDQLVLQLYSLSMKDGSKMFVVEIPLSLK